MGQVFAQMAMRVLKELLGTCSQCTMILNPLMSIKALKVLMVAVASHSVASRTD